LDYAIAGRNTDVIETLLNAKRDDQDGLKAMVFSKKVNLYMTDAKGQTVFEHALAKRHIKLLTYLVIQGAFTKALPFLTSKKLNLNILDDKDNLSMLHYGVLMEQEFLVTALLRNGTDVNVKEKGTGFTPLHYAVLSTYAPALKVLVDANAAIGPQDKSEAINRQFVDGIKMFLSKGMTPIDYLGDQKITDILISGNNTQVIETFFDYFKGEIKGATRDATGKTIQPKPSPMDPFDTPECLQKMEDTNGMTVAHWVAKSGHDGLLDVLFDKSKMATPMAIAGIDKTGRTPLHYAAAGGYTDIVAKLLGRDEGGLDIDTVSNDGTSALHEAAIHKQIPTVKKLIALGANKDLQDNKKKTAADYLDDKDKVGAGLAPSPAPVAVKGKDAPKTATKSGRSVSVAA
jgi:ankyrin repeat protein